MEENQDHRMYAENTSKSTQNPNEKYHIPRHPHYQIIQDIARCTVVIMTAENTTEVRASAVKERTESDGRMQCAALMTHQQLYKVNIEQLSWMEDAG